MFEKAKGLKLCKTILKKNGVWGFLLIYEKMYLVSHCLVKTIAVKFVIFFFNKYIFFNLIVIAFLIQKN